jgi:hypothetical protein
VGRDDPVLADHTLQRGELGFPAHLVARRVGRDVDVSACIYKDGSPLGGCKSPPGRLLEVERCGHLVGARLCAPINVHPQKPRAVQPFGPLRKTREVLDLIAIEEYGRAGVLLCH